jgi:hypothetical protein
MKPLLKLHLIAIALALVACSGPKVRVLTNPVEGSPTALRSELRRSSDEVLKREGLLGAYRKDPEGTLKILDQRYRQNGGPERLRTVAELCGSLAVKREETKDHLGAAGCFLDAARLARDGAVRDGLGNDAELRLIYNVSCSSLAWLLHREGLLGASSLAVHGPLQNYRIRLGDPGRGGIDSTHYDDLIPADQIELTHVDLTRQRQDGIGGAMVAHRARRDDDEQRQFIGKAGYALPVNATLEFPGHAKARLMLRDLLRVDHLRVAGREVPLAADWSTSLGYLFRYAPPSNLGYKGMLRPDEFAADTSLYELEPFDPEKIPVVLVHGLMSSPLTWVEMLNTLHADPVLRENYQGVLFRYPTGYPISRNAAAFRKALKEFRAINETPRNRSKMRRMILVGHSMGGILSNLQIRDSGDTLQKLFFDRPIDELELSEQERASLEELYKFTPDPGVERAIFIAAPHRGSDISMKPIGKLGSRLIRLPIDVLGTGVAGAQLLQTPGLSETGREELRIVPDSIKGLRAHSPFLEACLRMPVAKRVTYHSIIGRAKLSDPIPESSDKVVPYWSSHLDGAASEKIVHATHTTITPNHDAIEEVRRILYLHLGRKAP